MVFLDEKAKKKILKAFCSNFLCQFAKCHTTGDHTKWKIKLCVEKEKEKKRNEAGEGHIFCGGRIIMPTAVEDD